MASRGSGSQQKGKNHERELATILTNTFGVLVRRTPSPERWKSTNHGDVNASPQEDTIINDFMWEAKCRESWSILEWYKKAADDCYGTRRMPVVVATKNHEDNYAFLKFTDFLSILKELDSYRKQYGA